MVSKDEQEIFKAFVATEPNFAGEPFSWSAGADPPDILCETNKVRRIGVELREWLHEDQTTRARAFEDLEREIAGQIPSSVLKQLNQYWISLIPRSEVFPSKSKRLQFKSELVDFLYKVVRSGQLIGERKHWKDSSLSPTLREYLTGITIYRNLSPPRVEFSRTTSYSPANAIDALLSALKKKITKSNYESLKQEHSLNELYLVVYYARALLWNTPYYDGINVGIETAVEQARAEMTRDGGPFDKVFLFLAFEPGMKVFRLWSQT